MKYRKKPVVIDAFRYETKASFGELIAWRNGFEPVHPDLIHHWGTFGNDVVIPTLEGNMTVSEGDWVIRGIKGEFYPCKPDIFQASYEPAE